MAREGTSKLITFTRHPDRWILVPLGLVAAVAAIDLIAGQHLSLIALLIVGPLVASLVVGPDRTAIVSGCAVVVAMVLGLGNDFFGGTDHLTRILPVATGGVIAIWISRVREQREVVLLLLLVQSSVARALNESETPAEAIPRVLEAIGETLRWEIGAFWAVDGPAGRLRRVERWSAPGVDAPEFEASGSEIALERGVGLPGRVWETGRPASIEDVVADRNFPRAEAAAAAGVRGGFAFPVLVGGRVVGVIEFFSREAREPESAYLDTVASLGGQIGQYLERARAEDEVRASAGLKTAMLDSAFDCIVTMDHEGHVVDFNPAAERTFGYTREEAVGAEMADLIIPPRYRTRHREGLARYLERGEGPVVGSRFEIAGWRADGSEFPVELAVTRIPSLGPPLFTGYIRDITDRKRTERRTEVLADANALLNESLDHEQTIGNSARAAVPEIADWCVVDLLEPEGDLVRRGAAHVDGAKEALLWELDRRYPFDPDLEAGRSEVVRTGRPQLFGEHPEALLEAVARDPRHRAELTELGFASVMIVPLESRGDVFGVMSFGVADPERRFHDGDLRLALDLAERAASAIENARLYGERSYIARTLQESLLPPSLPDIPGVELAARYRAAGAGNEVGGDFYDIFQTGAGTWAAVIGDVRGKGADAAAQIGLARHTLRAAAMRDADPTRILATLNQALYREGSAESFCTALYAGIELMPDGVRVVLTSAGHPLPLILRAAGRVEPAGQPGTLIGAVPDLDVHCEPAVLRAGDSLVLYTDGVPEARSEAGFFGQDRLMALLSGLPDAEAGALADRIESEVLDFQGGEPRDDVAILVVRLPAATAEPARAEPAAPLGADAPPS